MITDIIPIYTEIEKERERDIEKRGSREVPIELQSVTIFWYECPLVVLACESLHVCTVCIWRCEHARFVWKFFYALYINFHSFIQYSRTLI